MDKNKASEMVVRYQTEKAPHLEAKSVMNPGETSSLWFSKRQIGEIWKEMEKQEATGLRAYLGAYGPEEAPELSNRITLIFTVTKLNVLGDEEDLFLEETPDWGERPDPDPDDNAARNFNHGSMSPPRHGGIRLPLDTEEI